jgi:hypothetical protein
MFRSLFYLFALTSAALAHQDHLSPAGTMKTASEAFLTSLDEKQKATALLPFTAEERENWHFIPLNDRKGLRLGDLTPAQRPRLFALLDTGLTERGMLTASSIIALEQYLREKEKNPVMRDPEKYFLTIFGEPSASKSWGWRFEGHHLSLNYTIVDGKTVTCTPAFFGTNPAEIREGRFKGQRPLALVEDSARAFVLAVQKAHPEVIFSEKPPRDVISGQERSSKALQPTGIAANKIDKQQRALLQKAIIAATASLGNGTMIPTLIDVKDASFAWAGSTEVGKPHYFRIQAPTILIEYANTQNDANHAHLSIRFPEHDFGRDLLKEHLEQAH